MKLFVFTEVMYDSGPGMAMVIAPTLEAGLAILEEDDCTLGSWSATRNLTVLDLDAGPADLEGFRVWVHG